MATPFIKRTEPDRAFRDHRDAREDLRKDFAWRCAYCLTPESHAEGIGFHVDHYMPSQGGPPNNAYTNLFWSCEHCNGRKSDTVSDTPYRPDQAAFLRVDEDQPRDHFNQKANGHLTPRTEVGRFTSAHLDFEDRQWLAALRAEFAEFAGERNAFFQRLRQLETFPLDRIPPVNRRHAHQLRQRLLALAAQHIDNGGAGDEAAPGLGLALERHAFESAAITEKTSRKRSRQTRRKRRR